MFVLISYCVFVSSRGANPNAKTSATDHLKVLAAQRQGELAKMLRDNKNRIISLEKAKAMKKIKELKEQQEKEAKNNKNKNEAQKTTKADSREMKLNLASYQPPEDDLNPFHADSYQDEGNPFLNSPVDSAYGGEGNPFGNHGETNLCCVCVCVCVQ